MATLEITCLTRPLAVARLTFDQAGVQQSDGTLLLVMNTNRTDPNIQVLVALAGTAKPAASLFGADSGADPSDGLGGGYLDCGITGVSVDGPMEYFDVPYGLVSASYQFWFLPEDGTDEDVVGSGAITLDTARPELTLTDPADAATGVDTNTDITLTFDKNLRPNGGTLTIYNITDGSVVSTITLREFSGLELFSVGTNGWRSNFELDNTIHITPANGTTYLPSGKEITVRWSDGAFMDTLNNPVAENSGTLFSFTTA